MQNFTKNRRLEPGQGREEINFYPISATFKRNIVVSQEEIIKYLFFLEILVTSTTNCPRKILHQIPPLYKWTPRIFGKILLQENPSKIGQLIQYSPIKMDINNCKVILCNFTKYFKTFIFFSVFNQLFQYFYQSISSK